MGAVGTGKTSAAMYPFADQLLRWRAADADRKLGGLVLEVKGDFCGQVRDILTSAGRGDDYVEISLGGNVCYNPLHNDLDPYALAYAIGSLLNNVHGRSKEPFWQQAYTDLVKFVILLRRLTHGYTTLADVYRTILDEDVIKADLAKLSGELAAAPEVVIIRVEDYETHYAGNPRWPHWFAEDTLHRSHPYDATSTRKGSDPDPSSCATRAPSAGAQAEGSGRGPWYKHGWGALAQRLRRTQECIIVFSRGRRGTVVIARLPPARRNV